MIFQLLEESNNLLKAEAHAEAEALGETLTEALGEVLTEELVEALGEVLHWQRNWKRHCRDIGGVLSQQPDQPRAVEASISTGKQKRTKTI